MHQNKIDNILSMTLDERVDYFISKVCDFEQVWGLYENGWATSLTDDNSTVISFWPEKEFAELCAKDTWSGYTPKAITLDDFINKWLVGMKQDGVLLGIFQTPSDTAYVSTSNDISKRLDIELEQYE